MSRLSRDDWALAALEAISASGVGAVAVESLARQLGATKGSFYWHFAAREELIAAALELWERTSTADVIRYIESMDLPPQDRLRRLFRRVFDPAAHSGADVALLSHADDPAVREVMQRVMARRIEYVTALLRQCGLPPRLAKRRAVFAYSAFLGHVQLVHSCPDLLKTSVGPLNRYADEVIDALVAQRPQHS